jgi:hypothetical protein
MKRVYELNEFKKMNFSISQMCYKQELLWCDHDSLICLMIRRFNVLTSNVNESELNWKLI